MFVIEAVGETPRLAYERLVHGGARGVRDTHGFVVVTAMCYPRGRCHEQLARLQAQDTLPPAGHAGVIPMEADELGGTPHWLFFGLDTQEASA